MKLKHDKQHRALEFTVGNSVWLCLNHHTVVSVWDAGPSKLAPKVFGPYQVLERIGSMAYRLQLPPCARIHNVFHVEFLRRFEGTAPTEVPPLPPIVHGRVVLQPAQVLCARPTEASWELLVRWADRSAAEATWEALEQFKESYPEFQLEDKLFQQARGKCYEPVLRPAVWAQARKEAAANGSKAK
jgi:hypothetical protein